MFKIIFLHKDLIRIKRFSFYSDFIEILLYQITLKKKNFKHVYQNITTELMKLIALAKKKLGK